jgi:hypothetical protein
MSQWRSSLEPRKSARRTSLGSTLVLVIRILVMVLCETQSAFALPVNKVEATPGVACTRVLPDPSCQGASPDQSNFVLESRDNERQVPDYYDPPINQDRVYPPIIRNPGLKTQREALRYDS